MDGKTFDVILADMLQGELAREAERVERDRRAREALRREREAADGVKHYTTSELVTSTLADGAKTAESVTKPIPEGPHAPVAAPPQHSAFPPPPTGR